MSVFSISPFNHMLVTSVSGTAIIMYDTFDFRQTIVKVIIPLHNAPLPPKPIKIPQQILHSVEKTSRQTLG